jgi:two-component system LytT family response regulator
MYSAIIIDDEPNAIVSLRLIIQEYLSERVEVVGSAGSVKEGVELIRKYKPEIVFLDIEMPVESGFELFRHFETVSFDVIFTTAYANYGIQAVKCAALDYLLKPVNPVEIRESLKRLEQRKGHEAPMKQIELLLANLQSNYDSNKIALPTSTGVEMYSVKEILYFEGDGNYSRIITNSGRDIVISKTLQWMEEILPADIFIRIHKSHLVNLGHVKTFDKASGNTLVLDNGAKLEVAHRRIEEITGRLLNR